MATTLNIKVTTGHEQQNERPRRVGTARAQ